MYRSPLKPVSWKEIICISTRRKWRFTGPVTGLLLICIVFLRLFCLFLSKVSPQWEDLIIIIAERKSSRTVSGLKESTYLWNFCWPHRWCDFFYGLGAGGAVAGFSLAWFICLWIFRGTCGPPWFLVLTPARLRLKVNVSMKYLCNTFDLVSRI